MPLEEKPKVEDKQSQTNASAYVQTISSERIPKRSDSQVQTFSAHTLPGNSEPQGITINFYANNNPAKADKPVQTDTLGAHEVAPQILPEPEPVTVSRLNIKEIRNKNWSNLASESRELRSFDYAPIGFKLSNTCAPHDTKHKGLMSSRKFSDNNKASGKMITDIERKKLEAELKATEEIAKIQQAVIEKRLALELASLQDAVEYSNKSVPAQQSLLHSNSRIAEEKGTKKQESSQEQDAIENQARAPPPRPPPPARAPATDGGKPNNMKSDYMAQASSDFTPLRNLIEKKINLERRSSKTSESKHSTQNSTANSSSHDRNRYLIHPDTRFAKITNRAIHVHHHTTVQPVSSRSQKARALWRSAVTKIKKIKPAPKPSSHRSHR